MELIYCPTDRVIAGFYTKPLQGSLFRKMREIAMGFAPFSEEECVVNSEKIGKISTENIGQK